MTKFTTNKKKENTITQKSLRLSVSPEFACFQNISQFFSPADVISSGELCSRNALIFSLPYVPLDGNTLQAYSPEEPSTPGFTQHCVMGQG